MHEECLDFLRFLRPKIASTTYRQQRFRMQRFFRWLEQHKKEWSQLSRSDIQSFLLTIKGNSSSRQDVWRTVRDFYAFNKWRDPPTTGITFRKEQRKLPRVPSQARIDDKIRSVSGPEPEIALRNRLMVELAYGCGLRRSELARLDIGDLDFAHQTAYIHGKGEKKRIVPLTGQSVLAAQSYLGERRACRGPLFVAYNRASRPRLTPNWIGTVFKGQTSLNTHLFRHACASHMLKNGCSTRVIQELLGHTFLTTTQRYTHVNKAELERVVSSYHPRSAEKEATA
jgi:site-specific recombinase XerD